ncbi:MAG: AMP-binding protein [Bacteroidetes bacterium]|nr:AMP-binding protein [Bacteroidota bacterium]
MNIYSVFEKSAVLYGNRIALIHGKNKITYSEMESRIRAAERSLRNCGIQKGDRILVFVPMGIELYIAVLAIFRMGAVVVLVDQWASQERVKNCLIAAPCVAMICNKVTRWISYWNPQFWKLKKIIPGRIKSVETETENMLDHEEALITFTSGSTGLPKAANRTHGFLNAQLNALIPYIPKDISHPVLCTLPVITLLNLSLGKTTVLPNFPLKQHKFQVRKMYENMVKNNVAEIISSPFYIHELANMGFPGTLELVLTGGGAVFVEDAKKWLAKSEQIQFTIFYGSTECEPVSHINAHDLLQYEMHRGLAVGRVDANTNVAIIPFLDSGYHSIADAVWESMVQNEKAGEIVVAGDHVLTSYIGLSEHELSNKIRVGDMLWHRTGDAGLFVGDMLFLLGRAAERIDHENGSIFPFEAEMLLRRMFGYSAGTLIKTDKGPTLVLDKKQKGIETELLQIFKERWNLEPVFVYVEEIPMDPRHHSKILYDKLRVYATE